jgi:hypothetical protein
LLIASPEILQQIGTAEEASSWLDCPGAENNQWSAFLVDGESLRERGERLSEPRELAVMPKNMEIFKIYFAIARTWTSHVCDSHMIKKRERMLVEASFYFVTEGSLHNVHTSPGKRTRLTAQQDLALMAWQKMSASQW